MYDFYTEHIYLNPLVSHICNSLQVTPLTYTVSGGAILITGESDAGVKMEFKIFENNLIEYIKSFLGKPNCRLTIASVSDVIKVEIESPAHQSKEDFMWTVLAIFALFAMIIYIMICIVWSSYIEEI